MKEINLRGVGPGLFKTEHARTGLVGMAFTKLGVVFEKVAKIGGLLLLGAGKGLGNGHRARGIGNPDYRAGVVRCNFDRRVHAGCGRSTNQQGDLTAPTPFIVFHFACNNGHLFKRGCNKARETNDVGIVLLGSRNNVRGGHHHPQVNNLEVIALQDNRDDVFTNVVYVAFDRGENHFALGLGLATGGLLLFNVGHKVCHRSLHDSRGFNHLGQKHFALCEEITHNIHAGHQRAFNYLNGPPRAALNKLACLFGVFNNKFCKTMNQGMFEPFFYIKASPCKLFFFLALATA